MRAGEKLSELRLEDQPMMLAFLPDGRRVLAATRNSVQLWDTDGAGGEPQQVWDFSLGTGVLALAALSSDSQLVAVGQRNAAYAHLLRAADGAEVKQMGGIARSDGESAIWCSGLTATPWWRRSLPGLKSGA